MPAPLLDTQDAMSRLVSVAGTVVGGSGHASVTVRRVDEPGLYTAWASADAARRIDQEQYDKEQGPCLEAVRTGVARQGVLADGGSDWPALADAAAACDVRSVLSTPMCTDETVIGALNVYSPRSEPFDGRAQTLATELAGMASAVLTLGMRSAPDRQAEAAVARKTVAMAQGAIMAWQRCGPEEAFAILRRTAVREHRPLLEVADQVLARASQAPA